MVEAQAALTASPQTRIARPQELPPAHDGVQDAFTWRSAPLGQITEDSCTGQERST